MREKEQIEIIHQVLRCIAFSIIEQSFIFAYIWSLLDMKTHKREVGSNDSMKTVFSSTCRNVHMNARSEKILVSAGILKFETNTTDIVVFRHV